MFVYQVLIHTPIWVWVLLAFLISRGLIAMRARDVAPNRVIIVPLVFLIWGLSGLFGTGDGLVARVALFAVGLAAGIVGGRAIAAVMPAPALSRETGTIHMPGSPVVLILIVFAFAVKYAGAVALATIDDPPTKVEIARAVAALGGLFAGLFWGRTLGQFQRALKGAGEASDLNAVVDLIKAPTRPAAG